MVMVTLLIVVLARAALNWLLHLEVLEFAVALLSFAISVTVGRILSAGAHSLEERGSGGIRMQDWPGDNRYPAVVHHVAV